MASDLHLHGVWIPLITPFDKSGAVDVEAVERLCNEYLADGVAGIVALGTTGEAPALDADEKRAVIAAAARACPRVCMGAVGGITASAHVCTARFVAMVECGLAGKLDDGRHHAEALLPVIETGFAEPNPAVWKGVLHAQGRIATPDVRMPMANASPAAIERCLAAVANAAH